MYYYYFFFVKLSNLLKLILTFHATRLRMNWILVDSSIQI